MADEPDANVAQATPAMEGDTINISSDSSQYTGSVSSDSNSSFSSDEDYEFKFKIAYGEPLDSYNQGVNLCEQAFNLCDLRKLDMAFAKFEQTYVIGANLWLKYLKKRVVVTQTPTERACFDDKCIHALGSFYDLPLAEFVVDYLMDQPASANQMLWANVLADYSLERPDFVDKFRTLVNEMPDDSPDVAIIDDLMFKNCINWNANESHSQIIRNILAKFTEQLEASQKQYSDAMWSKLHRGFINEVKAAQLDPDSKCGVIKVIFERCVAKFPTATALWFHYINHQEQTAKLQVNCDPIELPTKAEAGLLKNSLFDLGKRAIYCKPCDRINQKFIHIMEQQCYTAPQVYTVLVPIFERIEDDMIMTVELYLDYLAYCVRVLNPEDPTQCEKLRNTFQFIWNRLSAVYGEDADRSYEVLQLWAQVEYSLLSSPLKAASIWHLILGYRGSARMSKLWLRFIEMESRFNDGANTREFIIEALNQPYLDNRQDIIEYFRRFERCFGNYESLADCKMRVSNLSKYASNQPTPKTLPVSRNVIQTLQPKEIAQTDKKSSTFMFSTELEPNKIFIKNLYAKCSKEELTEIFQKFGTIIDVRLVIKFNKQFKGIAYIEYKTPDEAEAAVAGANGMIVGGQTIVVAISNPPPKMSASIKTSSPPKRKVATTLIPTAVVRQQELEVKRRKILQIELGAGGDGNETAPDNGIGDEAMSTCDSNGTGNGETETVVKKTNEDFRKLLNMGDEVTGDSNDTGNEALDREAIAKKTN